jgi:hypothetical protein
MKKSLATVLLCIAIILITLGIHTNNFILAGIGGFFAGVYNAIMLKMILKEK